jgi:glycerol transport system ATP-binding protein
VRQDVAAILFDEPLTVIDPHLKWLLRRKLKQIHQHLRLTLIYVTHDQVEALTFADRVVVMTEGQTVQIGSPGELFEAPSHTFVGHFIGSPGMNLLSCRLRGDAVRVAGHDLPVEPARARRLGADGEELTLGVRPEFTEVCAPGVSGAVPVEVLRVQHLGAHGLVTARLDGQTVCAKVSGGARVEPGPAWMRILGARTLFFREGRRIDP